MIAAQAGDEQSYALFLNDIYPVVQGFLVNRLGALGSEDDFTQECIMAVHKARHTYDGRRPIRPWLFAVVRYKAIDLLRKREKQVSREVQAPEIIATKAAPISNTVDEERTQALANALNGLSSELRSAVVLTKIEGLDTEAAAKREGISPVALRSRVSRAYKILRKKLERDPSV